MLEAGAYGAGGTSPAVRFGREEIASWRVCRLSLLQDGDLVLADLTGPRLLTLGADAGLFAAPDYEASQAWSAAFHDHRDRPDGLVYVSRYDRSCFCVALYDRARRRGLSPRDEGPLIDHPEWPDTVGRYEMRIV